MTERVIVKYGEMFGNIMAVRMMYTGQAMFRCYCGNEFPSIISVIRSGSRKSCGCKKRGKPRDTPARMNKVISDPVVRYISEDTTWTTAKELNYIKELRLIIKGGRIFTRLDLLRGYLKGCNQRAKWTNSIDAMKIIDFIEREIIGEEALI